MYMSVYENEKFVEISNNQIEKKKKFYEPGGFLYLF